MHMLFPALFLVAVIAAILVAVRWLARDRGEANPRSETALGILQKRYARGEIGREEFEQKRRDIEAGS